MHPIVPAPSTSRRVPQRQADAYPTGWRSYITGPCRDRAFVRGIDVLLEISTRPRDHRRSSTVKSLRWESPRGVSPSSSPEARPATGTEHLLTNQRKVLYKGLLFTPGVKKCRAADLRAARKRPASGPRRNAPGAVRCGSVIPPALGRRGRRAGSRSPVGAGLRPAAAAVEDTAPRWGASAFLRPARDVQTGGLSHRALLEPEPRHAK